MLATTPVETDEIIVEYYEPVQVQNQGRLTIGNISHDYRGVFSEATDGRFGKSNDSCEVNINCNTNTLVQKEKHAICRITFSDSRGSYLCTGALINNAGKFGTPYLLTANHAICSQTLANTLIAYFDYESPNCTPTTDGSTNKTVSGATLLKCSAQLPGSAPQSDFSLLLLPGLPSNFSPYFLGWDKSGAIPPSPAICIHHPQGDVKKISTVTVSLISWSFNASITTGCDPTKSKEVWKVPIWASGIVESGSSGAPPLITIIMLSDSNMVFGVHVANTRIPHILANSLPHIVQGD